MADMTMAPLSSLELERRILHGLSLEWELALWRLEPRYRSKLRKPLFGLNDRGRRMGGWHAERREISLERHFAVTCSWAALRAVLHHEMAHQMADELFDGRRESPHGPSFRRACRCLRIDSSASGQYQPVGKAHPGAQTDPEDRILIRIQKLMALAQSQNAHEAEAAMLKAHRLIARYHIDLIQLEEKRGFVTRLISSPAVRHSREKYTLAGLLQDYYFVQGIWVSAYVLDRGRVGRALEISGMTKDVELAAYVFDFVLGYIERRWRAYRRETPGRGVRKVDFAEGVVAGFRETLERQKRHLADTEPAYALVLKEDAELTAYMKHVYPSTGRIYHGEILQDDEVFSDGVEAGRGLVISKGVMEKEENHGGLLGR